MATITVCNGDGYPLTRGLPPASRSDEAAVAALAIAKRRREAVFCSLQPDGDRRVEIRPRFGLPRAIMLMHRLEREEGR